MRDELFGKHPQSAIAPEDRERFKGLRYFSYDAKYRFSAPADGCFAVLYVEDQRSNPPRSGHVIIDEASGSVIRLDEEAYGFPADFELARRNEEVSWDYVKIGSASHLLPVAANFVILYSSGARTRIEVEYRNHRHFEASSEITFHEQ